MSSRHHAVEMWFNHFCAAGTAIIMVLGLLSDQGFFEKLGYVAILLLVVIYTWNTIVKQKGK